MRALAPITVLAGGIQIPQSDEAVTRSHAEGWSFAQRLNWLELAAH